MGEGGGKERVWTGVKGDDEEKGREGLRSG